MNWYAFLADVIVCLHFGYIAVILGGMLLIVIGGAVGWGFVRNFWFRTIHLAMILIVVTEALLGIVCPLTVWEHDLRVAAGQDVSEGTFIGRLLHDLIFLDVSPGVLTVCYCLFGLAVLASWWFLPPRWPGKKTLDT